MKAIPTLVICILFSFIACNNHDYIIPTSIEYTKEEVQNGITLKKAKELQKQKDKALRLNTIGKAIPYIEVSDISGAKYNLQELIKGKKMIISSDLVCGWGYGHLSDQFPKAVKSVDKHLIETSVVCLIINQEEDGLMMDTLNKELMELNSIYNELYLIDFIEAQKINLIANPSRFYLDEDQYVSDISFGMALEDKTLTKEILNRID